MNTELSKTDIIFIYGLFQKKLKKIHDIESTIDCPFDKRTIENQKAPYLSVINKLIEQYPDLTKMDDRF